MDSVVKHALEIATKNLRACYRENGIIAGPHHFTDYWARDSFFAAFGSLKIGDTEIVDKQISLFFSFQRRDGLIPYRIMRGPVSLAKYLGKPKYYQIPRPTYRLRGIGQYVLDGTTLTLLFAALRKEKKYLPQIKKGLDFLLARERDGLLWDGPMAEWNDIVWKQGNLLYSNIIYWYMYDRLANWLNDNAVSWSPSLEQKRDQIAQALRQKLWNGNYFADWYDYKRQDYFYPYGNCLAIAWGLTNSSESKSILAKCQDVQIGFTLETNDPAYPWWRVDFLQRVAGMSDYQNRGILWWQPITSYGLALERARSAEAEDVVKKICNKITKDQKIYECYERSGQPIQRMLYQSESPFAWAAGSIISVL